MPGQIELNGRSFHGKWLSTVFQTNHNLGMQIINMELICLYVYNVI